MSLAAALAARLRGRVVVVGVGNPLRGDDAAGSLLARRIAGVAGILAIDAEEVPENIVGQVVAAQPETVVFVDATELGAAPGSVALVERDQAVAYTPTTHRLPLGLAMKFVATSTGADVFLIAIQPRQTTFAAPLSDEVARSVAWLEGVLSEALHESVGMIARPEEGRPPARSGTPGRPACAREAAPQ